MHGMEKGHVPEAYCQGRILKGAPDLNLGRFLAILWNGENAHFSLSNETFFRPSQLNLRSANCFFFLAPP